LRKKKKKRAGRQEESNKKATRSAGLKSGGQKEIVFEGPVTSAQELKSINVSRKSAARRKWSSPPRRKGGPRKNQSGNGKIRRIPQSE